MKNKGMTLLEITIAVALLSFAAVSFLPAIAYGFISLVNSQKVTQNSFDAQMLVEQQISVKQNQDPTDSATTRTITVFGTAIKVHVINVDSKGVTINAFLPKKTLTYSVPVILAPAVTNVRKSAVNVSPQPTSIDALDNTLDIFANDVIITTATNADFLMNVFRWYISEEMDVSVTPSNFTKDYIGIKEWNEAKKLLPYSQSSNLNFIPNLKIDYNKFSTKELTDNLALAQKDLITRFGNRYVRYGVTPYSIVGRIGKEELSVPVYLSAPRIVIVSASFVKNTNKVNVKFESNISSTVKIDQIVLNETLGAPSNAYRSPSDSKTLVLEFDHAIIQSSAVANNQISIGGVASETYGEITVWSGKIPNGTFTILPPA